MVVVKARNIENRETLILGEFDTYDEALDNVINNLEWDEDDNIEEWEIRLCFDDGSYEIIDLNEFYGFRDDYDDGYDEMGFDPYEGCYTYDC